MDKLTQALNFRHACKKFDTSKKINETEIEYILEAGRLSPSGFGIEPWHFVVVDSSKIKSELRAACYDQEQVTSCSHFVIALYRKANHFTLQSEYLRETVARTLPNPFDQNAVDIAGQKVINFYEHGLANGLTINHSLEMQVYLACANMLTAAAYHGIDSCPISGIQYDDIVKILEKHVSTFSAQSFGVALCMAFGYRLNEPKTKIRWPLADMTTYLSE